MSIRDRFRAAYRAERVKIRPARDSLGRPLECSRPLSLLGGAAAMAAREFGREQRADAWHMLLLDRALRMRVTTAYVAEIKRRRLMDCRRTRLTGGLRKPP